MARLSISLLGSFQVTLDGEPVTLGVTTIPWDPVSAAKGEYKHFMQKEIFEQGRTLDEIDDALDERVLQAFLHGALTPFELLFLPDRAAGATRLPFDGLGKFDQAFGRVFAAVEEDVFDQLAPGLRVVQRIPALHQLLKHWGGSVAQLQRQH